MKKAFIILILFAVSDLQGQQPKKTRWSETLNELSEALKTSQPNQQQNPQRTNNVYGSKSNIIFRFNAHDQKNQNVALFLKTNSFISDIEQLIEKTIRLKAPLYITFLDSPSVENNAFYDPSCNCIQISYSVIQNNVNKVNKNFLNINLQYLIQGIVMQIMFHEMTHYLIANYNLSITGKEENAADQLSIMAMLFLAQENPNLANSIRYGILGWYETAANVNNRSFVDEHAPNMERYYDMMSLYCGSNTTNAQLQGFVGNENYQLTIARFQRSKREYEIAYNSWTELMAQFF